MVIPATATTAAAITAAASALGGVQSLAAEKSEKIRLGIVGCGGMMNGHVSGLVKRREAVSFAWLCDVDPRQIAKISKHISGFQKIGPQRTARGLGQSLLDCCAATGRTSRRSTSASRGRRGTTTSPTSRTRS